MNPARLFRLTILLVGLNGVALSAVPLGRVTIEAGDVDRPEVPLVVILGEEVDISDWPARVCAVDLQGQRHAAQLESGSPARLWLVAKAMSAGESQTYAIMPALGEESPPGGVEVTDDGRRVNVAIGDRQVLAYNHQLMPSPIEEKPQFARSGMLHPVRTPTGQILTDPMPLPHHTHQHAIMMAWVDTTFEGRHVDFWNSDKQQGSVEHTKVDSLSSGPVFGEIICQLRHIDLTAPDGPRPALNEQWQIRVYNLVDYFLFDITSTQSCATDSPLVLNKYHYGGMAVRGAPEWKNPQQCRLVTSEGLGRRRGNHTRPQWVSLSGQLEAGSGGIVVMGSPHNTRHPQPVRLHPEMPYFCFTPMVLGEMRIEPGTPYVSNYRFLTHDGELNRELAYALHHCYVDPPQTTFIK